MTVEVQDGPRVVTCKTYGSIDLPLTEVLDSSGALDVRADVLGSDYFSVHLGHGTLSLQAGGYVGLIPVNDRVVLRVLPRMPVSNLTKVLAVSEESPLVLAVLRTYESSDEQWNEHLLDLYSGALIREVTDLRANGLYREYERREETTSYPRGRVLVNDTVRTLRSRGIAHAARTSWFARTSDVPANRCLKYAIWSLATEHARRPATADTRRLRAGLNAAYDLLDGVTLDHRRGFLTDPLVQGVAVFPALRAYYRSAVDVAVLAIERHALRVESFRAGGALLPSMVLNLNRVVEAYLRNTLKEYAARNGWAVAVLDGHEGSTPLFADRPRGQKAEPDIVLRRRDGSVVLVCEVKNKPLETGGTSQRYAIEQAVTYAVAYGLPHVVLLHPASHGVSAGPSLQLIGTVGAIAVHQYRFDFGAEDLTAEGDRFADALEGLAPGVRDATRLRIDLQSSFGVEVRWQGNEVDPDGVAAHLVGDPEGRPGSHERVEDHAARWGSMSAVGPADGDTLGERELPEVPA